MMALVREFHERDLDELMDQLLHGGPDEHAPIEPGGDAEPFEEPWRDDGEEDGDLDGMEA